MHLVDANGAQIPALGFGTWELRGAEAHRMVLEALDIGYRHIDTAQMYGNETEVGAAIRESGLPRDDVFVTTKIWPDYFAADQFEEALAERLEKLKLGWIDLLLLHWPSKAVPLAETIRALDGVKERGIAKHIGVSNFTTQLLDEAVALSHAPIVTNQVEYHPFLGQKALLAKMRPLGMALTAYCPVARGRVFGHPVIQKIARRHGRDEAQVTLRWLVQQDGVIAIPRTSKPENARANFAIFEFELTPEEMSEISALASPQGRVVLNPAYAPEWDAA